MGVSLARQRKYCLGDYFKMYNHLYFITNSRQRSSGPMVVKKKNKLKKIKLGLMQKKKKNLQCIKIYRSYQNTTTSVYVLSPLVQPVLFSCLPSSCCLFLATSAVPPGTFSNANYCPVSLTLFQGFPSLSHHQMVSPQALCQVSFLICK